MNARSGTLPLSDLFGPVRLELERINRELVEDLRPEERDLDPLVDLAVSYRGKQLRPALVCLAGKSVGGIGDAHIEIAKIVELLHTATLVHDDVLDGARMRRQQATVNAAYGTEVPVLLGDYIYARAFHMAVCLPDPACSRLLSETVRRICQGEITQILHRFDYDWDEDRYYRVIADKTASLYAAACRLGGLYSGGDAAQLDALDTFGLELGIAFQIVDDCLDLGGDEDVVGKSLGTDLGKGKLTLPMLFLMREPDTRRRLRELMAAHEDDHAKLADLRRDFPLNDAIDASLDAARGRVRIARQALSVLPNTPARDAMERIADYVLARRL